MENNIKFHDNITDLDLYEKVVKLADEIGAMLWGTIERIN